MTKQQALNTLKRPLKFGDPGQITAYARLETQAAAVRQMADIPDLVVESPGDWGVELDKWDERTIRDAMGGGLDVGDAELRFLRDREAA